MPVQTTYPGVYIEEIPSGVRTIVGVSTSVAAFVGHFTRGPLNEPVHVFNFGDFEREFGGLLRSSGTSYAIQQFFRNGGSDAWVVRTAKEGSALAAATTVLDKDGADSYRIVAGRSIRGESVTDPGEWGNSLRVLVDYETRDLENDGLFNLTVQEVEEQNGRQLVVRSESYLNVSVRPDSDNALRKVNDDSKLIQLIREEDWPEQYQRPLSTGTLGTEWPAVVTVANGDRLRLSITDRDGEVPGDITLTIDNGPLDLRTNRAAARAALQRALRANAATIHPQKSFYLSGATVRTVGDRYLVLLGTDGAGFDPGAQISFEEVGGGGTAETLGLLNASVNVQQYALRDGDDGEPPEGGDLKGSEDERTGMHALEEVSIFNILCIPEAADLDNATEMAATYQAAEEFCERKRAFLLIDLPGQVNEPQEALAWLEDHNLRHRNAAAYFPRVRVADEEDDFRLRSFPPSGTIAGIYARTDASRGVWKAPAGLEAVLRGVQGFDYELTDPENGQLNPVAMNALRSFPIYGNVIWGARTLEGADRLASEWKYIPVRRLALYIEESLYRGTQWAVFEPNDEPLWSQLRLNVGTFMHNLFRQGAFQGSDPRQAYFVKCDGETTTQADIDLGIVNIVVGFAPLKPAEFVIIKIKQVAGQTAAA